MKSLLLVVPMVLATLAVYFYFSLGFYKPVRIELIHDVHFILLAKPHQGAYHKILPVIQSVESWAKAHDLHCEKTFGEYIDDPRAVDEGRLRSFGGCIIAQVPAEVEAPMEIRQFSQSRVVRARFSGSPSIGPFKVYPQVESWMEHNKLTRTGSALEVYIPNDAKFVTEFYFPIAKEE